MIQWILASICFLLAAFLFITEVIGLFRFRYVLDRMHAAALGDTMGILMIMAGLAVASGINLLSLKLLLIVFLFWTASPVASHLIGRLELTTNEELDREVKLWKR